MNNEKMSLSSATDSREQENRLKRVLRILKESKWRVLLILLNIAILVTIAIKLFHPKPVEVMDTQAPLVEVSVQPASQFTDTNNEYRLLFYDTDKDSIFDSVVSIRTGNQQQVILSKQFGNTETIKDIYAVKDTSGPVLLVTEVNDKSVKLNNKVRILGFNLEETELVCEKMKILKQERDTFHLKINYYTQSVENFQVLNYFLKVR
ncbi:MAG: hypothetical protein ACOYNC_01050 [Bacteroidales bacterium]